jgi:hypothetical protein
MNAVKTRAPNLKWSELSQDDKEAVVRASRGQPRWARIFLCGETWAGSDEENEALLAHNDGLFEPLFVLTARGTMKMTRYNNAIVRLIMPESAYRRAWERERERLGLPELDSGVDFIHAIAIYLRQATDGRRAFPFKKFGTLVPGAREAERLNEEYLGGYLLFGKFHYRNIGMTEFFARLPDNWFGNLGLRALTDAENELAAKAARSYGRLLTNTEIAVLRELSGKNPR